jgi:Protein of unknown function (DUF2865)
MSPWCWRCAGLSIRFGLGSFRAFSATLLVLVVLGASSLRIAMPPRPADSVRAAPSTLGAKSHNAESTVRAPEHREGSMTPLQDWWFGGWPWGGGSYRRSRPPSSTPRSPRQWQEHPGAPFGETSGRKRASSSEVAYRTICVRLCDGYYFPISFSVSRERFANDKRRCESACGAEARLFVYRNPGAELEDMEDLEGRPYRRLPKAFLYRNEYVPSCKCNPHPWEKEALDRHRKYGLTAAASKDSKGTDKKLQSLVERKDTDTKTGALPDEAAVDQSSWNDKAAVKKTAPRSARKQAASADTAGPTMRLGLQSGPKAERAPVPAGGAPSVSDWRMKVFGNNP